MKKILYIIDQIHKHGGGERVLANKANYFASNNLFEVFIVTSEQLNKPPCYKLEEEIVIHDLKINYDRTKSYFHPVNFLKLPKHLLRLRKLLKEINPDVIITLSTQFDFYFLPFICGNIPCIREYHSSAYSLGIEKDLNRNPIKTLFYKLSSIIESKYSQLVLLNEDERLYYKGENISVIPNAISFYPEQPSTLENKVAISAGRIAPVKGYEDLIDIWAGMKGEINDWKLLIYGDGDIDYVNSLRIKISKAKLEGQICLMGSTNEIDQKFKEASIYLMTSITECFPMVLLEALSCGLPVISYDCPHGPRNIINNGEDGFIVPHRDASIFAEKLKMLMDDLSLRKQMGKNARKNVLTFTEESVMKQWLNLFNSMKV